METKVKKKLQRARAALLFDHPFFGYLAISLELVEDETLNPPTMGTDGSHLYFHPDFVNSVNLDELQGVIAHEVGHCALQHLTRRQSREPKRWNVAADFAVNDIVLRDGMVLPKGALHEQDYEGKYAEWVYSNLPVSRQYLATLDSHGKWEVKSGHGKDGKGNGGTATVIDATELEQTWREKVAQAANAARSRGKFPAHLTAIVGEVLQPKLDWKSLLQDVITSCSKSNYRIMPPNKKHIWRGIYLPSITGETIQIAFIIDDSGSISDAEIRDALSEVKGICDGYDDYTLYLFTADARVQQRWELHPFDPLPKVVTGRGGTDFRPALEEADKLEITSIVYFTDLDGPFLSKAPNTPVIWLSVTDRKPPFGYVIRYPRNGSK